MNKMRLLFLSLCMCFLNVDPAQARQVKGRTTLPSDCTETEAWVTDYSRSTGAVTAYCRQLAAGKKRSKTELFWSSRIKPGRPNGWPNEQEKNQNWKVDELGQVLGALEWLPHELWLNQIKGVYRLKNSKVKGSPSASGDGSLVFYDDAFSSGGQDFPKETAIKHYVIHEVAHEVYRSLSDSEWDDYQDMTDWFYLRGQKKGGNILISSRKSGYMRPTARSSDEEDFAVNFEYFLLEPEALRKTVPGSYYWIKKHFGDKFGERK